MKKNIGGSSPTNSAKNTIELSLPFSVKIQIEGSSDLLFHRWNNESVLEKSQASKGSKAKKYDDLESYVYRNEKNNLAMPGEYLRQACIEAAKYKVDPRSPRKSCKDLYKAGLITLTNLADLGCKDWDYEDKRRVVIQRNSVTRSRPALKMGWKATFDFLVNIPEYIDRSQLLEVFSMAGRLVGLGDFRPTFGRFQVISFE